MSVYVCCIPQNVDIASYHKSLTILLDNFYSITQINQKRNGIFSMCTDFAVTANNAKISVIWMNTTWIFIFPIHLIWINKIVLLIKVYYFKFIFIFVSMLFTFPFHFPFHILYFEYICVMICKESSKFIENTLDVFQFFYQNELCLLVITCS